MEEDVAEWGKAAAVVRVEADRAEVAWAAHLPPDPAGSVSARSAGSENRMSVVCPAHRSSVRSAVLR
jgi:hypothetical protein